MDNYYDETIDLKNLFFYILKKWKLIILGLIVGLLLGCGFSFYKMNSNSSSEILDRLNSDSINKNNVIQYADYVSLYDKEVEYSTNSILMNLNTNNMYTGNLVYSVSALEKDIKNIENYYDGLLDNNLNEIVRLFNNQHDPSIIKELIYFDFVSNSVSSVSLTNDNYSSGSLNVRVYGENEKFVQTVLDKIIDIVETANEGVLNDYSSVSIDKVKESIVFGYNSDVANIQINKINSRQNILNNLTNAKNKLSSDELLYYDYYIAEGGDEALPSASFSKKWPLLFGVGLAVVVAGIYFLIYLFDDHIKSFDEIKDRYKLPLLGTLNVTNKHYKGIDKFINDLDKKEYNDLDYIKSSISLLDCKKIMLCNAFEDLNIDFSKLDPRISVKGDLNIDDTSLSELKYADGVILVSKLWDSKNSDIQRQIDIVNNAGKKVVGVIGLE